MRSPRAALYARVSSEQQAHSRTIASQVASLRERITADGARLEPEHAFLDESYSGATLLRSARPPPGWYFVAYTFDGTRHRLYLIGSRMHRSVLPNSDHVPTGRR